MKTIKTSHSELIFVSDLDYAELSKHKWFINNGYAFNKKLGYMHRLIAQTPTGYVTDHKNGVRHDNQRENLRIATRSQNGINRAVRSPVHWHKRCWRVKIVKDGKSYWKYSMDVSKLLAWREQKAKELYGEYAFEVR